MNQTSPQRDPRPSLILIIPDTRLADLPPFLAASVRGCEAAYHGGCWYVAVPAQVWHRLTEAQAPA